MSMDDSHDVVGQDGGRFRFPDWRPSRLSRGGAILAAFTLVVGLTAGYAAGQLRPGNRAAAPPPRPRTAASSVTPPVAISPVAISPALTQNATGCSAQVGRNLLQLGVPVTNQSATAVTLGWIDVTTPLGGLRIISQQWGPCGALPTSQEMVGNKLAAGDTIWLTATFKVLVKCPGPLPVQFSVGYDADGSDASASLPGFSDLSQVPYTGCPPN
ncbi:MAG TPA: hypothetical protein VNV62_28265 [Trebonia sp.]|jgi:hypothetical protein|nr:hypothetical protein [Trebonia sp.]